MFRRVWHYPFGFVMRLIGILIFSPHFKHNPLLIFIKNEAYSHCSNLVLHSIGQ